MQSNTRDESTPPAGVSGAGSITAPVAAAHVQERNDKAKTTSAPDRDWGPKGRVQSVVTLTAAKAVDVEGTLIGDVTDLMVDIITGRIAYVVVSVGAMLGLGGERYAVPWSALSHDAEAGVFRLRVAKSVLADAPLVEREFWPEMTDDERWARSVHEHFRAIPYWVP